MKGIFLAFVCALAFTTAEEVEEIVLNQHGCPVDILITHFIPHKYCDRYYICVAGFPTLIKCPEHTLFHIEANVCNWAQNVDCGERIHPEPESVEVEPVEIQTEKPLYGYDDPSQAPEICAQPGSDDILISHEDCRKYYQCWLGRPIPFNCPSNLFYNPKIGGCDWQANVDCKLPEEDDSHLSYPERLCNKGSFLVPNRKYCNRFYKCGPKGPTPMECQTGTVFDYEWQTCNWPIFVNCGDKIIKPIGESEEEEDDVVQPPIDEIDVIEPPVDGVDVSEPEVPESEESQPEPEVPVVPESEETQPEPEVPVVPESEETQPEPEVPVVPESEETQPEPEVPVVPESGETLPEPQVPVVPEPEENQPEPDDWVYLPEQLQ